LIQAVMYFALGLLVAGLVALLVTPAIWRRAMRLTRARIESAVPMSRDEIDADKDHLRAVFAISNRRLETDIGRLNQKLVEHVVAVNRKRDEIAALTTARAALEETVARLESNVADLTGSLSTADEKLAAAVAEVAARDERLAERAAALAAVEASLADSQLMGEEQRLELVARDTQIGNLGDRVASAVAAAAATARDRDRLAAELEAERTRLAAESRRADGLEAGLGVLQAERAERLAELERRATELRALETEIASQKVAREAVAAEADALRAERDALRGQRDTLGAEIDRRMQEVAALNAELFAGARHDEERTRRMDDAEAALAAARAEIAALSARLEADAMVEGDNVRKAIAATEAEKAELARRLAALEEAHASLVAENAELRRIAGTEWERERQQTRLLRDRLGEIAASVVRMAEAKPGDDRAPMPAADAGNGGRAAPSEPPIPHPATQRSGALTAGGNDADPRQPAENRTLAERLRALQHAGARH
jgi:septal ring factor EnvC (AmiA/AmiB activator)